MINRLRKLVNIINMNSRLMCVLMVAFFVVFGLGSAALLVWAANSALFFPMAFVMFTVYIFIFAYMMDRKH